MISSGRGEAFQSRGCQIDRAVQFVDPAPTPRHSQDMAQPLMPSRPHSLQKVVRRRRGLIAIRPPGDAM